MNEQGHDRYRTLRSKLAVFHTWPGPYLFKFIVPQDKLPELVALFEGYDYTTRPSSKGRWVSFTCEREMPGSDEVIEVYEQVDRIEGAYAM